MQDEIVSLLANRLGHELQLAEARRVERSANPDSMDHYFIGLALYHKGVTPELLDKARSHFDRALALDPDSVEALVQRAWVDLAFVGAQLSDDRPERLHSAAVDLSKALRLRPDKAGAHAALGFLRILSNRAAQGIAECERALAIDRNLAAAHGYIGLGKVVAGRNEDTEGHVLEALRISPRDAGAFGWMHFVGVAKLAAGRDEEAVAWLNRSIELGRSWPTSYFWLAAALAHLGRHEEACEQARAGLELNPGFTIARLRSSALSDNLVYLAGRERVYDGLRKAGVPEE
jgi:tetratricopeptide (TPR) repeat protein